MNVYPTLLANLRRSLRFLRQNCCYSDQSWKLKSVQEVSKQAISYLPTIFVTPLRGVVDRVGLEPTT